MKLLSKAIKLASLARTARPVTVIPIGDIQWNGSTNHTALSTLQETIRRGCEDDAYFIGMGDYIDAYSPSNRQRLRGAALYDTAEEVIDQASQQLVDSLYNQALKPSKGRWLGLLEGHHFTEFSHGQTSDQYLAKLLGAPFLGTTALIRLVLSHNANKSSVVLWAHHGAGGGGKVGTPLSKLENLAPYWGGVDVFLIGHSTKGPAAPIDRIHPVWHGAGGPRLEHRKVLLVSTGGFSKSYGLQTRGDYPEQRLLNPSQIGVPIIRVRLGYCPGRNRSRLVPTVTVEV